jgi:hypothetical protein
MTLARLKREHEDLKKLFRCYFTSMPELHRLRLLRLLCRDIRLHYTTEACVFFPACARALADHSILDRAAIDYGTVMPLVQQVESAAAAGLCLESAILELRQRVFAHIDTANGPFGLFELVRRFDLGWEAIEKALVPPPRPLGRPPGSPGA